MKLTINVPKKLVEIIDDLASTLGISRKEAAMHFLRADAMKWHAAMLRNRTE